MSERELAPVEPAALSIIDVYERFRCPAEIVVPYKFPGQKRSILGAYVETRYRNSLWNMDFPWVVVMAVAVIGTGLAAFFGWALTHWAGISSALGVTIMACFPLVFVILVPVVYPLLVAVNMALAWGSDWPRRLLGPTHIGLTDSGFKLYVRGRLFYNYPNLAIWPEIYDVDITRDQRYLDTYTLQFVYQTGFGRTTIHLPLHGFATEEDLALVLEHFATGVPVEYQSEFFKQMAEAKFAPMIESFRLGTVLEKPPDFSDPHDPALLSDTQS